MKNIFETIMLYFIQYGVWLIPLYFLAKFLKRRIQEAEEKKRKKYIIDNSKLLKELKEIGSYYAFHDLKKDYCYTYECKTKAEYDRFDYYEKFRNICYKDCKELRSIKIQMEENDRWLERYLREYVDLTKLIDEEGLGEKYREEELKILDENRLRPIRSCNIKIIKKYTSPKGQNHYIDSKEFLIHGIEQAIKEKRDYYKANAERKARVEYERSLMTPRLRYKVMQRDGFKCVICGASSKDGVTLHVDHIKPVSKGGKTEMNNLRTLCDRCNMGKGALYIEDGVN